MLVSKNKHEVHYKNQSLSYPVARLCVQEQTDCNFVSSLDWTESLCVYMSPICPFYFWHPATLQLPVHVLHVCTYSFIFNMICFFRHSFWNHTMQTNRFKVGHLHLTQLLPFTPPFCQWSRFLPSLLPPTSQPCCSFICRSGFLLSLLKSAFSLPSKWLL